MTPEERELFLRAGKVPVARRTPEEQELLRKACELAKALPRTPKEDRELLKPLRKHAHEMCVSFDEKEFHLAELRLPQPWRALYTTTSLYAEVKNGGFHQFFWNSEGKLSAAIAQDLWFLGAVPFSEIFKRAVACAEEYKVVETKLLSSNTWEEFTAGYKTIPWDKIDLEFSEESPTLLQYAARYAREHRADFEIKP